MSGSARLRADQKLKGGGNYDSSGAIQKGKFTEKLATSPLWSHLHRLRCFLDSMMRTACLRDMVTLAHDFHIYALYLLEQLLFNEPSSPPPKYQASGSGRDTFHTSILQGKDGWNHPTDRMGFGPPSWDPALLGRPKTSASQVLQQRQRMSRLSRPRSSTSSGFGSPGLLVPGKNFRQ